MSRALSALTGSLMGLGLATPASACSIWCALSFAPGPHSILEILVVLPVAATVVFAFVQAMRYTLRPGERTPEHIKWRILEEDEERL